MHQFIGQPPASVEETPTSVLEEFELSKREYLNLLLAIQFNRKKKVHFFLIFLLTLLTLGATFSLFAFAIVEADVGVTFLSFRLIFSIFSWFMVFFSIFAWYETVDGQINRLHHGYYDFYRFLTIVNGGWLFMLILYGWIGDLGIFGCPVPYCAAVPAGPVRFEYWLWFTFVHLMAAIQLLLLASMNGLHRAFKKKTLNERERIKAMLNVLLRVLDFVENEITSNKQAFFIIVMLLCGSIMVLGISFLSLSIPIADAWNTWQWYRMLYPSITAYFIYYSTRTWYSTLAIYKKDFGGRHNSAHSALLIIHCVLLLVPIGWSWIVDVLLNNCPMPLCSVAGGFPIRWEYLLWIIATHLCLLLSIMLIVMVGIASRLVHDAFLTRMMFDKPDSLTYSSIDMQPDYAALGARLNPNIIRPSSASTSMASTNATATSIVGTQFEYSIPLIGVETAGGEDSSGLGENLTQKVSNVVKSVQQKISSTQPHPILKNE